MGKYHFKKIEKGCKLFSRTLQLILFVILFNYSINGLFSESNRQQQYLEYQPRNLLGFIRNLVSNREYYRAYLELNRLNTWYPVFISEKNYYVSGLFLLFKGKQFDRVLGKRPLTIEGRSYPLTAVKKQVDISKSTDNIIPSFDALFKTDACLYRSDYSKANFLLTSIGGCAGELKYFLIKRIILTNILLKRTDQAVRIIESNSKFAAELNIEKYKELVHYSDEKYASLKEPGLSLFYGIIPGMGYVYSGRKATGVLAFIVVSVFSTLTYFSFKSDNNHIGIFLGSVTGFFYTGSIIGGYLETKKYNRKTVENLKYNLFEEISLERDRNRMFERYGLPGHAR